jgi:hypothetical protein
MKNRPRLLLFILGFLGILSLVPVTTRLIMAQPEAPAVPVALIQILSIIQPSLMLFLMVWLGAVYSRKVGLRAPVVEAVTESGDGASVSAWGALRPQLMPALVGGIAGGVFLVLFYGLMAGFLPSEFLAAGRGMELPWYTKLLYGGITEEILVRWGVMSFLVWAAYRLTQRQGAVKGTVIGSHNFIMGILGSALVFAAGHLPAAFTLTAHVTPALVAYIIVGNAGFGVIAGYLYWKRGLECAILAHMVAHLVMNALGILNLFGVSDAAVAVSTLAARTAGA